MPYPATRRRRVRPPELNPVDSSGRYRRHLNEDTDDPGGMMAIPNGEGGYNERYVEGLNRPLAFGDFRDYIPPVGEARRRTVSPETTRPRLVDPLAYEEDATGQTRERFRTPPLTTVDERGRPRLSIHAPDPLEAEQQLRTKLETYQPQKRSRLKYAVQSGLSGRGFLQGLIGAAVDPTIGDQEWQQRELAMNEHRIGGLQRERRADVQDRYYEAQIRDELESSEARKRVRPELVGQVMPDGTTVLVPKAEGIITGRPAPPKPVEPDIRSGSTPVIERQPDGGYKTIYTPPEKPAEADFSGPLAAANFRTASRYWAEATAKELEAAKIVLVKPGTNTIDPTAEAQQQQLLAEAKELKKRTWDLQEKGNELDAKSKARPAPAGVSEASIRAEGQRRRKSAAATEAAIQMARTKGWIP